MDEDEVLLNSYKKTLFAVGITYEENKGGIHVFHTTNNVHST